MRIEENKPLAPFTSFGIGGPARWFAEATNEDEIVEAVAWAGNRPLFVLGGGSNLLVSDSGFDGLALRVGLRGIAVRAQAGKTIYEVSAGENWDRFVKRAVADGCAGVECLAGIPGTVGGTPVQNVGAYGQEVASAIARVRAYDLHHGDFVEFEAVECGFGYRRSRFNSTDRGRYLVTRVDYRLAPGGAPIVRYAELERALAASRTAVGEVSLAEVVEAVYGIRKSKGMLTVEGDAEGRNAGSFFKNPVVEEERLRSIAENSAKEPPRFPAGPEGGGNARASRLFKVPAAWLIEQAGFAKGYRLGRAGISSRHTLALVNLLDGNGGGGASAAETLALATHIGDAVEKRFGIRLEMEPVMVGF